MEPFGSIWSYLEPLGAFWSNLEPFWTILDPFGTFGENEKIILIYFRFLNFLLLKKFFGDKKKSGLVWSGLVWSDLVWSGLVWSGVWSCLVRSGLVWFHFELFEATWDILEHLEEIKKIKKKL